MTNDFEIIPFDNSYEDKWDDFIKNPLIARFVVKTILEFQCKKCKNRFVSYFDCDKIVSIYPANVL